MEPKAAILGGRPAAARRTSEGLGRRLGAGRSAAAARAARQLGDLGGERGGVALQHEQADLVERLLDPGRVDRGRVGAQDLRRGRRLGLLVGVEQLLVQLLARARGRRSRSRCPCPGSSPEKRIMSLGQVDDRTGSPISSTNTSPPCASEPARMTSWTASGIVMK